MTAKGLNGRAGLRRLKSPAKLNLGLRITGRRKDGYHLLESLFWPIDLVDEMALEWPADAAGLRVGWAANAPVPSPLPQGGANILDRVLAMRPTQTPPNLQITLEKRIPIGGGLGGGSSNAATLLNVLSKGVDPQVLYEEAASLGADVPFFLSPKPSWVTGVGERCQRLKVAPDVVRKLSFLVVLLPQPLATPKVFQTYRGMKAPFSKASNPFPSPNVGGAALKNFLKWARNDLEEAAVRLYPLVGEVLSALRSTPCLLGAMSGSGSTCFALYPDPSSRDEAAKVLQSFFRQKDCKSLCVGTLGASGK